MTASPALARVAPPGGAVSPEAIASLIAEACPAADYHARRVLLIVPDGTRTAPVGLFFKALHAHLGSVTRDFDVLVALGTHTAMSEAAICARLEITGAERATTFRTVRFFNHEWDNPAALTRVGTLGMDETAALTGGRLALEVPVEINRRLFDYDQVIIIGPVFPHEVVGFSGGNKYLFPGVGGPRILNFFHWLGALVTNPMIIGTKRTPVRQVVDRAGGMVRVDKRCFALVVAPDKRLAGAFAGTPEDAWDAASDLSAALHIVTRDRPFHLIVSCAPVMYPDLWTGGKCMYKLEPVLADGGELIIHAPHISEVSVEHGRVLLEVGYHCRDYFLKQWDRFQGYPWGVLAHSSHVHGIGNYENGIETPRARVTLATGIPEAVCRRINLGWRDPASVRPDAFAGQEDAGVLVVPRAGETLYRLRHPPAWAGGNGQGANDG